MDNTALFLRFRELLEVPLDYKNKVHLKEQLVTLEALRYKLLEARVGAYIALHERRFRALPEKDNKQFNDIDRKVIMEADPGVLRYEKDLELLLGLEQMVNDRIEIAAKLI